MARTGASVFKRCGCRDQHTGRQLGQGCPRLRDRGHGSWYVAVELSAGPDGRRRRVRLGGHPTRAAAQETLARLRTPGGRPRGVRISCTTGQWLARWLADRESLGPSARRSYQQHLDTYLMPRIGSMPLVLTARDVRFYQPAAAA
jgi:hypothetical protein